MRRIIKAHELSEPVTPWQPDLPGSPREAAGPRSPACPNPRVGQAHVSCPDPSVPPPTDLRETEDAAREKGLTEGIRAAEESYRVKFARLESLSSALQEERAQFFTRVEPELVRLAIAIAEKVIGREVELRPDTVVEIVRNAMKRLRERESLRVSLNPRDVDQVKQARDDLVSAVDGVRKLEIIEDRRVDGGCVIESPNGTLDARITTQIGEITNALTDALPDALPDAIPDGVGEHPHYEEPDEPDPVS